MRKKSIGFLLSCFLVRIIFPDESTVVINPTHIRLCAKIMAEVNDMKEIDNRRSIRSYLAKEIEEEKLIAVLEAGRKAPSAKNRQMWHFYVVSNKERKDKIMELSSNQKMIGEAPVCILVTATDDYMMRCRVPAYVVDASIALSFMLLEAQHQGLGTCWIGSFDQDGIKKYLELPENETIIGLTPLGYPDEMPREKTTKDFEEVVSYLK